MPQVPPEFQAFIDALRLRHFTAEELLVKVDQTRGGARNRMPPRDLWPNIVPTALVLDALREELGAPIRLLSGYRSPAYNAAVGGASGSQHKDFRALDFTCDAGTPDGWASTLREWRHRPFPCPVSFAPQRQHAPIDAAALRINETAQGVAFLFEGGIGVYPTSRFVHMDTRGINANWRGS